MKLRLSAFLILCVYVGRVDAQSSPADVVRAFFKAEDEGRWRDAARLLDLSQFEPIRKQALDVARARDTLATPTAEQLMKWQPDMPRAVAEYQAKQMKAGLAGFDWLPYQFARTPSADSLRSLSTEEAAARWLEAKAPAWQEELARRKENVNGSVECPQMPDSITTEIAKWKPVPARILGTTSDSDSLRYVVIGPAAWIGEGIPPGREGVPGPSPSVVSLRKTGGGWRILPTVDIPNSIGMNSGNTIFIVRCKKSPADSAKKK